MFIFHTEIFVPFHSIPCPAHWVRLWLVFPTLNQSLPWKSFNVFHTLRLFFCFFRQKVDFISNALWRMRGCVSEVESSRTHFEVLGLEASSPRKLPCPRLEDSTIFWTVEFCCKTPETLRKICEVLFLFSSSGDHLKKNFWRPFFWDRLKKCFENLFFSENTCACVLGPWPREGLSLTLVSSLASSTPPLLCIVFGYLLKDAKSRSAKFSHKFTMVVDFRSKFNRKSRLGWSRPRVEHRGAPLRRHLCHRDRL